LRICFIAPFNPVPREGTTQGGHIGGVERYSDCLTQELAGRGLDVTILCTGESNEVTQRGRVRIVQRRRAGVFMRTPFGFILDEAMKDYDLYHVPATYPSYSELLPLLAKLRGKPSVLDYHFDVPPMGAAVKILAPLYYAFAKHAFATTGAIILKNHGYEMTSPGLRTLPSDIFRVIPNGVDTDFYAPVANPTRDYLLFVGRLVPFKGVATLLEALALVPAADRLPLKVAGSGPERANLEAKARALGLDVEFLGFVTNEQLRDLYANARATVLPSISHQESFGMTLIESMACGTPVIASELPGTTYVAAYGGNLFARADPKDLARALVETARGTRDAPRGHALAAAIRAKYSWAGVAAQIHALYLELDAAARGEPLRRVAVEGPAPPETTSARVRP